MRALTNSEKSYNNLLSRVSEIKFYVQTTCDRRDENYYNKLFLKALVEQDPYALNEYSKIVQHIYSYCFKNVHRVLFKMFNGYKNVQDIYIHIFWFFLFWFWLFNEYTIVHSVS